MYKGINTFYSYNLNTFCNKNTSFSNMVLVMVFSMIVEIEPVTHKKSRSLLLQCIQQPNIRIFLFHKKKNLFFRGSTELCGKCMEDVSLGAKSNSKSRILRKGEGVSFEVFFHLKGDFLEGRKPWKKFIFIKF